MSETRMFFSTDSLGVEDVRLYRALSKAPRGEPVAARLLYSSTRTTTTASSTNAPSRYRMMSKVRPCTLAAETSTDELRHMKPKH